MYAIVDIGGFQEMVKEGETLRIPLASGEEKTLTFEKVLLLGNGDDVTVGSPYVSGASVIAEILGHGRADKIRVVKAHRRKRYRRLQGHRQHFTNIKISKIKVS